MLLNRFERWLAISSNLAVLVGIIFLALEISQNSDITKAQLCQARAYDGAAAFNQMADSEHIAPLIAKLSGSGLPQLESFTLLSDVEKMRTILLAQSDIRILDNTLLQCELKFFEESFCETTRNRVRQEWSYWNAIVPGGVPTLYERLYQVNDQQ